jgi:hypothetical protein
VSPFEQALQATLRIGTGYQVAEPAQWEFVVDAVFQKTGGGGFGDEEMSVLPKAERTLDHFVAEHAVGFVGYVFGDEGLGERADVDADFYLGAKLRDRACRFQGFGFFPRRSGGGGLGLKSVNRFGGGGHMGTVNEGFSHEINVKIGSLDDTSVLEGWICSRENGDFFTADTELREKSRRAQVPPGCWRYEEVLAEYFLM